MECADNGLTGLNMLKDNNERADVVLMDLRMPVRSSVGVGGSVGGWVSVWGGGWGEGLWWFFACR